MVLDHTYDRIGNRTNVRANIGGTLQPNGVIAGGQADFQTTYAYDNLHRMSSVQQTGQTGGNAVADKFVSFTYDAASQLTDIQRYAAATAVPGRIVAHSHFGYDKVGRLTSLVHADTVMSETNTWDGNFSPSLPNGAIAAYYLDYDAANRLESLSLNHNNTSNAYDFKLKYTYDNRNQLETVTVPYGLPATQTSLTENYQYDSNGNRTGGGYSLEDPDHPDNPDDNRVTSDGTYDYRYDAEGNRVERTSRETGEVTTYAWDYRNRFESVTTTKVVKSYYDVFDRRIGKNVRAQEGTPITSQASFVWDGDHIALQFTDRNGDGVSVASEVSPFPRSVSSFRKPRKGRHIARLACWVAPLGVWTELSLRYRGFTAPARVVSALSGLSFKEVIDAALVERC
ncbi:MAG: hypothetical protein O3C40_36320 [Planctomycetota bacterium]|nr:hypothetical protein [Planctomycetota bacterium]